MMLFLSKSTAMVMSRRSDHLTTIFFLKKLEKAVNQYLVHELVFVTIFLVTTTLLKSAEGGELQKILFHDQSFFVIVMYFSQMLYIHFVSGNGLK